MNLIKWIPLMFLISATSRAEVCVENATGLAESHFAFEFIPNPTIDRSKPGIPLVTSPKYFLYKSLENQDVICAPYSSQTAGMAGYLAVFINDHDNYHPKNDLFWITRQAYAAGADQTLILSVRNPSSGVIAIKKRLDAGKWSSATVEKVMGLPKYQ